MIFTPTIVGNIPYEGEFMQDGRALMELSDEDGTAWADAKERNLAVVVTDLKTNTRWVVERAYCGLGCRCAAEAQAVVTS